MLCNQISRLPLKNSTLGFISKTLKISWMKGLQLHTALDNLQSALMYVTSLILAIIQWGQVSIIQVFTCRGQSRGNPHSLHCSFFYNESKSLFSKRLWEHCKCGAWRSILQYEGTHRKSNNCPQCLELIFKVMKLFISQEVTSFK
jgi:hypothetical protein